jgi:hypothetical protein
MISHRRLFYLSSANRGSGTDASNYTIDLPNFPTGEKFTHVCLLEANIPKSYYMVQAGFNTFTLIENGIPAVVTIPPANYSATCLRTCVGEALTAASLNGWVYTITAPTPTQPATGKFTFIVTGSTSQPSIVCTTNLYEALGFAANSVNTFVGDMGYSVKQLIYAPFNVIDQNTYVSLDHDNRNGAKILSYMTQLDSVNRQQFTIDCQEEKWDDWNMHRRLMRDTVIQNRDIYQYNWVHIEDFSDLSVSLDLPKENLFSGIPITGPHGSERIWTISGLIPPAGGGLAFQHYTFIVTYKTLIVGPGRIEVSPAPPNMSA